MGGIILDTSHHVPMHMDGTKWVDMPQHKIVHHYDVVMLHTNENIFIGLSQMLIITSALMPFLRGSRRFIFGASITITKTSP